MVASAYTQASFAPCFGLGGKLLSDCQDSSEPGVAAKAVLLVEFTRRAVPTGQRIKQWQAGPGDLQALWLSLPLCLAACMQGYATQPWLLHAWPSDHHGGACFVSSSIAPHAPPRAPRKYCHKYCHAGPPSHRHRQRSSKQPAHPQLMALWKPYLLKVFFTNKNVSASILHKTHPTDGGHYVASASTLERGVKAAMDAARQSRSDRAAAALVGQRLAEKAAAINLPAVHFQRPRGLSYAGKLKALIEAARAAGLRVE